MLIPKEIFFKELRLAEYKNAFSSLYNNLNSYLKETSKEIPCKSLQQRTNDYVSLLRKQLIDSSKFEPKSNVLANIFLLAGFCGDLNKEVPHVFLSDNYLLDFFKTVDFSDFNLIKSFAKEFSDISNTSYFVLHSKEKSVFLCSSLGVPGLTKDDNLYLTAWDDKDNFSFFPLVNNKKTMEFIKNNELSKIALNFLAYCKTFPECLIDGVPIVSKDEKKRITNSKILNTTPQIIENIEDMKSGKVVIPHFRKGHFRLLNNNRFVNKKGQVVFVKATMVNGQAKVLNNSNKSKRHKNDTYSTGR